MSYGDGWCEAADDLERLAEVFERDGVYDAYNGRGLEELAAKIREECAYDPGGSRTVAIDADGVCHSYHLGWHDGTMYGHVIDGCADALAELAKNYKLVIFTARDSLDDVRRWFEANDLDQYVSAYTGQKPSAVAYIDDRSILFCPERGAGWPAMPAAVDELVRRKARRPQ